MREHRRNPALITFTVLCVILLLYVGSYFMLVERVPGIYFWLRVHRVVDSPLPEYTGLSLTYSSDAGVRGRFAQVVWNAYLPMHEIDSRWIRPDYWKGSSRPMTDEEIQRFEEAMKLYGTPP